MRMPTDVAVAANGTLFVADGVNDRILQFSSEGKLTLQIKRVGDRDLSRPIGIATDSLGRLWIADTGHCRVLAMSPDGSLAYKYEFPSTANIRTPSVTDVAASGDNNSIVVVDNHNHRLLRVELSTGTQAVIGRPGESLGQLNHPFMIAIGRTGAVFVSDVLNGRVSCFTAGGQPAVSIGQYGADMGQLYRPKGIATDADGNIWIADSIVGVIQVFSPDRRFIDVLRDEQGNPLHLRTPTGITLDTKGNLYVAELVADRIVRFEITHTNVPPIKLAQATRDEQRLTGNQARSCTVCHMEWMEPFSHDGKTALMELPLRSADEPWVSKSDNCLSCHDGSMVDSRRRVWQEHGHRTGIKPPPNINVPASLPLVDGKIACRTCHSAHVSGQFNADVSKAVFLRVKNESSELCVSCHTDKSRGPSFGTHPTGGMPWPVPKNLIDAGARTGNNPRELTCQVCHTPHGSANDHLLVLGTNSNELCMSCHDQMRPGMFRDDSRTKHPLRPVVNAEQAEAVKELGTKLSEDNRLICLSCHKLHHGKGEHFMLAEELTDSRFCIRCHSQKTSILGSKHDLRKQFPDEKNRLGMTSLTGGPCSSCHLFHRYARAPESSEIDPGGGKCITCHQADRCASSKSLGSANHPKAACVECHDPHRADMEHYLRAPTSELCIKCHEDKMKLVGGPHDYRMGGRLADSNRHEGSPNWSPDSLSQQDVCLACHRPHGSLETGLFRVLPASASTRSDGGCIACHSQNSWEQNTKWAAAHPQKLVQSINTKSLPLVANSDGSGAIGCRTCHNPHADNKESPQLLRIADGQHPQDLCLTCHSQVSPIVLTGHTMHSPLIKDMSADSCKPCHSVHAMPNSLAPRLLTSTASQLCISCHRTEGRARPPAIATHPDVPMYNSVSNGDSSLPLFDLEGNQNERGKISCATCHIPHGRMPEISFQDDSLILDQLRSLPPEHRSAMRLMLRPFDDKSICINCHGPDALQRFLYFHDPVRRRGVSERQTSSPRKIRG